jgi:hypothetical protein
MIRVLGENRGFAMALQSIREQISSDQRRFASYSQSEQNYAKREIRTATGSSSGSTFNSETKKRA